MRLLKWKGAARYALLLSIAALLLAAGAVLAGGGGPVISRYVLAGGGGESVAEPYALRGTVGQAIAGEVVEIETTICAGFWCGTGGTLHAIYLPLVLRG